ncbi:MAG: urease accessory protein UreE [Ideonella sp.]
MLTITKCLAAGRGLAPVLLKRAATVSLDWDIRQRSRFQATDSLARPIAVFLPRGSVVRGGDVLVADDGSLLRVIAADQPLMQVRHCSEHGSAFDLMRAAYHLGNRHIALELRTDRLLLEPDHVLADMLRQMHLIVTDVSTAFEPESGAYAAGPSHAHGHSHGAHQDKDHDHGHSADHHDPGQVHSGHGRDHAPRPADRTHD